MYAGQQNSGSRSVANILVSYTFMQMCYDFPFLKNQTTALYDINKQRGHPICGCLTCHPGFVCRYFCSSLNLSLCLWMF